MDVTIRSARSSDTQAIRKLILQAFPGEGSAIAQLVEDLLVDPTAEPLLSLVATLGDQVVGHVLFTATRVGGDEGKCRSAILAPLAVEPSRQRQGIGGRLVAEGLRQLREQQVDLVFVLGHPEYYPRHGFTPAGVHGLHAPYPVPEEHADAWMVQALSPELLGQVRGTVRCADALSDPKYWVE
jgi:putative acetyltransferase